MFRIQTRDDEQSRRFWLIEVSCLAAVVLTVGISFVVASMIG